MSPADELDALRAQALAVTQQLEAITARIEQLKQQPQGGASSLVAVVDSQKCTACGVCADVCPAGAIQVNNVAEVDREKCTGCGACVAQCPRAALSLHAR
jgi:ferredoxin